MPDRYAQLLARLRPRLPNLTSGGRKSIVSPSLLFRRSSFSLAMNMATIRKCRGALLLFTLIALVSTTGCLGRRIGAHLMNEYRSNEGSFNDAPSLPKADFGRPPSELKSTGTDKRSREIERSLGVGG
jgi:hypothetical protein